MAQLGDTTVVGDLSATGKLWGEGNRIYVPDYNTLNPGELNMQVGEIMTVYNDTVDINVSHGPWESSSAGYIIRNNSATPGTNNSVFTLMIHRSLETADFATRVWRNNKWNNWVIGGTGGSGSTKPSNIHYWDGKSSTITPSNLDLWKEVLEEVKKDKFSIVICSPSYLPNNTSSSTFVLTTVPGNGKTQVNSLVYASTFESTPSDGVRSYVTYRDYVTLTMTNNVLTEVSERVRNSTRSPKYVSTENYTDMVPFKPTQDYHPATKKYVDDFEYKGSSGSSIDSYTVSGDTSKFTITKSNGKLKIKYLVSTSYTTGNLRLTINQAFDKGQLLITSINSNFTHILSMATFTQDGTSLGYLDNSTTTLSGNASTGSCILDIQADAWDGPPEACEFTIELIPSTEIKYLSTSNTSEYIPTEDYHPATKKYVDNKAQDIFYWDGKSSTTTPYNKELWKEILDKAKTKTVLVYSSNESSTSRQNKAVFVINPSDVGTTTKSYYGLASYSNGVTTSNSGTYYYISYPKVTISYSGGSISSVGTLGIENRNSSKFLPTNGLNEYIPTKDYHPATKKYVDDLVYRSSALQNISITGDIIKTSLEGIDFYQTTGTNGQIDIPFSDGVSKIIITVGGFLESSSDMASIYAGDPSLGDCRIIDTITCDSGGNTFIENKTVEISNTDIGEYNNLSIVTSLSVSSNLVFYFSALTSSASDQFLSATSSVDNGYTPSNPWDPTNKRYVDSKVFSAVKSNDGSVLNWVTMTKAEFEAAKENDTIEDGTVINVLDDFEVGAGNFNIFYWDGQSSSTNTDNLYLWRSAIQAAEDYGCSMILEKDPGNSNPKGPIIYYFTKEDLPTSSVTIYSTCYKNTSGNIYTKGNVSNAELYRRSVALTFSNGALSSVGASTNSILTAKSYLTTETLSTTYDGKYFIPSKSYQPVSKGYLETQIITTQKTSKTCELPTDIT